MVVHNFKNVEAWITTALGVLTPIIMGFVMAFVINIPMSLLEKHLFKKRRGKIWGFLHNIRRPLSIFISIITIVAVLVGIVAIVKQKKFPLLNPAADPMPVYIGSGLCSVAVLVALFSTTLAYYAMWALAAVVFALAVYYTVKQL